MHRYGIEEEYWFEAARTGLEQRGFRLRVQQRSLIVDKEGRLPRIFGGAREFMEFVEKQGIAVDQAAFEAADRYGDGHSDLRGRVSASAFETPPATQTVTAPTPTTQSAGQQELEQRLAELRIEQDKLAQERRAAHTALFEKRQIEERCADLEADRDRLAAELRRLEALVADTAKQRDMWQLSAATAEDRLRLLQADHDGAPPRAGADKRFDQLRRFLARELHPDLAGTDDTERVLREALFKRVWAKIEQLQ